MKWSPHRSVFFLHVPPSLLVFHTIFRAIPLKLKSDHVTPLLFGILSWLRISLRIKAKAFMVAFAVLHDDLPQPHVPILSLTSSPVTSLCSLLLRHRLPLCFLEHTKCNHCALILVYFFVFLNTDPFPSEYTMYLCIVFIFKHLFPH